MAVPLLRAHWEHNPTPYRTIIANALDQLLGGDRIAWVDAGPSVDVSLMAKDNTLVLHLVNYHAERRATIPIPMDRTDILNRSAVTPYPQLDQAYDRLPAHEVIEEIPPRYNVAVRVRLPGPPTRAYLAPSRDPLPYRRDGDLYGFVVPELHVHQMAVFDYDHPIVW